MTTSQNPLRIRLGCRSVGEFRQKFPNGRTARAFVATDVPREIGMPITVDFLFADGRIGARGQGVVASKGRLGGRHGIVLQLAEIVCGDEDDDDVRPPDALPQRLSHSPIIDDLVEELPAPASAAASAAAATKRPWRWRWPVAAAATSLALAAFLVGVFYGRGTPARVQLSTNAGAERVQAALAAADDHISAGRLVGPGDDNALAQLLAARRLDPGDRGVEQRLEMLSAKFEELADAALRAGDPAEAATHLQAALNATPGRESLQVKMRAIERGAGAPTPATTDAQ